MVGLKIEETARAQEGKRNHVEMPSISIALRDIRFTVVV